MKAPQKSRQSRLLAAAVGLGLVAPWSATARAETTIAVTGNGVEGVWFDQSGRAAIEIARCGELFCGYIYWVRDVVYPDGKPVVDKLNPDPQRRNKPICGTRIIADLSASGRVWSGGQIYNPEDGENFDVEISLISPNKLNVLGLSLIHI